MIEVYILCSLVLSHTGFDSIINPRKNCVVYENLEAVGDAITKDKSEYYRVEFQLYRGEKLDFDLEKKEVELPKSFYRVKVKP